MGRVYPSWTDSWAAPLSDWPDGCSSELRKNVFDAILERFPDWDELRRLGDSSQEVQGAHRMLMAYYRQLLPRVDPPSILRASDTGALQSVVERIREAEQIRTFTSELERRFFPQLIEWRKQAAQDALDSWS
ncbi:MAG: hypothetical protein IT405_02505 [Candidatus Yanofskybacteria bacterium]|nr:hypothetical protein [Candidatus Yanofskybacteria bacterium]